MMRKCKYAFLLYVTAIISGMLCSQSVCAARTLRIEMSAIGRSPVIMLHKNPGVLEAVTGKKASHIDIGASDTIEAEPGCPVVIALEESCAQEIKVKCKFPNGTEQEVTLNQQKREELLGRVPYSGNIELTLFAGCTTVDGCEIRVKPAGLRDYTPILSYVFSRDAKPSYGLAEPVFSAGNIFGQPIYLGTVVSTGADNQKSFIGGAVITRLYSSSRYAERPSRGMALAVTLALGNRGFRIGEGNPGSDWFASIGISAFIEPMR